MLFLCLCFEGSTTAVKMKVANSTINDIPEIFRLYKLAADYQILKYPKNQWPIFDLELVTSEVVEERQFKLVVGNEIACIWAITFRDPQIWEGSGNDSAIYIHRVATNPFFRGNNYVSKIVEWSMDYASMRDVQFVRMGTCGENTRLIEHYSSCGFNYLGMKKLRNTSELPSHYHNADVCFFEIELE